MIVVIFRARIRSLDDQYAALAQQLRDSALQQYNCQEFVASCENNYEIALSYWHSEDDIAAWKQDAQHRVAQQRGQEAWYADYQVEICTVNRKYASKQ